MRRGARAGEDWNIHYLDMNDRAGNYRQYLSDDFAAAGYETGFAVTGPRDRRRPSLESLRLGTLTPDVRRGARTVRVRAVAADDLTVRLVRVLAWDPRHRRRGHVRLERTAGSARRGTWAGELRIPRFVPAGRWDLEVRVTDNVGKVRILRARRLAAVGLPAHLTVSSRTDTERAAVARVRFTRSVDVRSAPGRVRVRVRATDERSGVSRVNVIMWQPPDAVVPAPSPSRDARRVSGSGRDGIWKAVLRVEDCASWPGEWAVSVWVWDRAGHRTITNRGTVRMAANDRYSPHPTTSEDPLPTAGPVTVTFPEAVTGIGTATVTVLPEGYSRFRAEEPPPAVAGSWSCVDASGSAAACDTGAVRVARFFPSAPLPAGADYEMWPNLEHIWTVTDLAGNPVGGPWRFSTAA